MKKKIAVVAPDLEDSGGVQSIVEMVVRLIEASDRYECKIIALATSASDRLSVRLRHPASWRGVRSEQRQWRGRTIIQLGCTLAEFEFMRYRPRRLLGALVSDCDMVQVVGGFAAWGAALEGTRLPVANWSATRCLWERSTLLAGAGGAKAFWRKAMTRIVDGIDARALRLADKVMVMNPLMQDYAVRDLNVPVGDVVYAPPGVDIDWFRPAPATQPGPASRYVLAVGRLGDSRKNPEMLLDAFLQLRKQVDEPLRLVLAGATGPGAPFWQRVAQAGLEAEVEFHERPDKHALLALYQQAACVALSSNEEGFGVVLVEAMACAVPVVATRCGGPQGIVTDAGDGFLVEIGDVEAMTARLALLCKDDALRRRMGERARRTVEERFSEQASAAAFFRVWDALTAGRHAG